MPVTAKTSTADSALKSVRQAIRQKRAEARRLHEDVEDLLDCLDALEARADGAGKKRFSLTQARARLSIASA